MKYFVQVKVLRTNFAFLHLSLLLLVVTRLCVLIGGYGRPPDEVIMCKSRAEAGWGLSECQLQKWSAAESAVSSVSRTFAVWVCHRIFWKDDKWRGSSNWWCSHPTVERQFVKQLIGTCIRLNRGYQRIWIFNIFILASDESELSDLDSVISQETRDGFNNGVTNCSVSKENSYIPKGLYNLYCMWVLKKSYFDRSVPQLHFTWKLFKFLLSSWRDKEK